VTLRQQAEDIWQAGVAAVDSANLVRQVVRRDEQTLHVCGEVFPLDRINRIVVVGAGKAGAGMSAGLEAALGADLVDQKVTGWVNVPTDCIRSLRRIQLHPARPAAVNEPTAEGVNGSECILDLVASLTNDDLCLVLISGGGSALLPAPIAGISLTDKLSVTRSLMNSGATIQELNTVRKRLSRIKGGGLVRAAAAGRMIALIISDVVGDPLDIIASGPTVCDSGTAQQALSVLQRFFGTSHSGEKVPASVWRVLQDQARATIAAAPAAIQCRNVIIGNNRTALIAAAGRAAELGFEVRSLGTDRQGIARDVGVEFAKLCLIARDEHRSHPICYLAGGEPIVKLTATDQPRKGGRNQEVALAAGCHWGQIDADRMLVLSGGLTAEDGPTDAAGACFDHAVQSESRQRGLNPIEYLDINNSYPFFEQCGGLLKCGPTHTNVMDLQIGLIASGDS